MTVMLLLVTCPLPVYSCYNYLYINIGSHDYLYVKGVTRSKKPTEKYHPTAVSLRSIIPYSDFKLIVFGFTALLFCFTLILTLLFWLQQADDFGEKTVKRHIKNKVSNQLLNIVEINARYFHRSW